MDDVGAKGEQLPRGTASTSCRHPSRGSRWVKRLPLFYVSVSRNENDLVTRMPQECNLVFDDTIFATGLRRCIETVHNSDAHHGSLGTKRRPVELEPPEYRIPIKRMLPIKAIFVDYLCWHPEFGF
jgi:hypothetical protein